MKLFALFKFLFEMDPAFAQFQHRLHGKVACALEIVVFRRKEVLYAFCLRGLPVLILLDIVVKRLPGFFLKRSPLLKDLFILFLRRGVFKIIILYIFSDLVFAPVRILIENPLSCAIFLSFFSRSRSFSIFSKFCI